MSCHNPNKKHRRRKHHKRLLPLEKIYQKRHERRLSSRLDSETVQKLKKEGYIKDTINIALAGNPNVGKSVIFNQLTGLSQTIGNWPGRPCLLLRLKLWSYWSLP